ncbi:hypothetical protein [Nitrospirillum sp. BR 11163]|uniref:hypothetical protein n=1 Tax=Nitrospirillum sp. BR 11163 TaxID=3104323 RepID=UPI002AFEDAF3|nr:hypothetical protein [Nitrospirillum sp. BR 11163]MEA1672022.1 hypothetical protein [Nitrospirillum sp. BR 11163]
MLPDKSNPRWRCLVSGELDVTYSLLATKFLMARLNRAAKADPSAGNLSKLIDEAYVFFQTNERIAAKDLQAIFG